MKKIVIIILTVLLILLIGQTGYANGPEPSPHDQEVLIDDCTIIEHVQIIGKADDEEGVIKSKSGIQLTNYTSETKIESQRIIYFHTRDYKSDIIYDEFYLVATLKTGETVTTNVLQVDDFGTYLLNIENESIERGVIEYRKIGFFASIFLFFILIPPLFITIIVEVLTGEIFKIEIKKHIVLINCITNPIMNVIIIRLLHRLIIDYWLIVLILELAVLVVEFIFYIFKYKEYSKLKLVLFTLIANASSFGVYISISTLISRLV